MASKSMSGNKVAIGIDFGTVYSCVGVFKDDNVKIVENERGNAMFPSYVAFTESGVVIGEDAKDRISQMPLNTIYDVKRLIGLTFDDSILQEEMKRLPYTIVNCHSKPKIQVQYKSELRTFYPEEIAGLILMQLKRQAEAYLGRSVSDAVITVPAYFTDRQRQATKDSCFLAGLNVLRIINEPTAAAIAAGLSQWGEKKVLVFDLGGGTFSVSILAIDDDSLEVLATGDDPHIGGADFEQNMAACLLSDLKSSDKPEEHRLTAACEKAKISLTTQHEARLQSCGLDRTLTRAEFETMCAPVFKTLMQRVQATLKDAKMDPDDITHIVLAGGASQIPKIKRLLADLCINASLCKGSNVEHAVAIGATIQAARLCGIKAPSLSGMLVLDVLPHSLGIEVAGGYMDRIIKRNHTIPAQMTAVYSTSTDNQTSVTLKVFEGEYEMTSDNHFLGLFEIHGFQPAKRGEAAIAVTFEVNHDGILNVTARDVSSVCGEEISVHYDKGALEIGSEHRMVSPCKDELSSEKALTAYASAIQRANSEDHDDSLTPLDLAMARRQCNLALTLFGNSKDELQEKEKLQLEIRKLESALQNA